MTAANALGPLLRSEQPERPGGEQLDTEFIRRMVEQDDWEDFPAFFALHVRPVLQIRTRTFHRQIARDVEAELSSALFLRLKNKEYDFSRPFKSWLSRVILNLAIDINRKRRSRQAEHDNAAFQGVVPSALDRVLDGEEEQIEMIIAKAAANALSPTHRLVVLSVYPQLKDLGNPREQETLLALRGITRAELAKRLGLRRANIDQIVARFNAECHWRLNARD